MITRKSTITKDDTFSYVTKSKEESTKAYYSLLNLVDSSNTTYLESSIFEDCILTKYLETYNLVKNVTFNQKLNYMFIDSFISEKYIDKNFHVDKTLNIDVLNGDLTLPIKASSNLPVASVIIENSSNGTIGSSLGETKYDNINDILTTESSKLFVYEKVVSELNMSDLNFNITLKLNEESICNAIYIKLYTDEDVNYAKVNKVRISKDGITYSDVTHIDVSENKADKYIRFLPSLTRYISISFSQNAYNAIQTNFGTRYRYSIGIREITPKRIEYDYYGEYVSIPLSMPKNVNSLHFYTKDVSNDDIKYYISANNGGLWNELTKNGINILDNEKLGLDPLYDIDSIRVKILMDKTDISVSNASKTEYYSYNSEGRYILGDTPLSTNAYVGKHISYGPKFKNDISIGNIEYIGEGTITNPTQFITLNNVPYYDGIKDDLIIEINGSVMDTASYTLMRDIGPENSILKITNGALYGVTISVYYKPFEWSGSLGNIITLPAKLFIEDKNDITIYSTPPASGESVYIFTPNDFEITGQDTIKLNESAYSHLNTYQIYFTPSVDITEKLIVSENIVYLHSLQNSSPKTSVRIDYVYKKFDNENVIKYYTPICNEYKVEYIGLT